MNCAYLENKLVPYLDGMLAIGERRQLEAHLAICLTCRERAAAFRSVWDVLDELPPVMPSAEFDSRVRERVQQEPVRAGFWSWLVPSTRMAFAVTALLIASIWLSSFQPGRVNVAHVPVTAAVQNNETDFGMIKDLPVLEDYDVLTTFDALSELPVHQTAESQPSNQM